MQKLIYVYRETLIWLMFPLWWAYLGVMNAKRIRDLGLMASEAEPKAKAMLGFGLFLDFFYNVTVMTLLFGELPREWLVTQRVIRHKFKGSGWRQPLAAWFCATYLDNYDPDGCHCKHTD